MNLNKKQRGFSLIEILVVMSILIFIAVISSDFIIRGFKSTTFDDEQKTAIQNARRGMEIMTKEIRGANNSERGDYSLEVIEEDDFTYYSDIDDDGYMEKVQYYLDGLLLKKVVIPPGPLNDYNMPSSTIIISDYINNQSESIFSYYDSDSVETYDIDSIRLINIRLKVNVTPERAPNDYYIETDVHLRNLKSNL